MRNYRADVFGLNSRQRERTFRKMRAHVTVSVREVGSRQRDGFNGSLIANATETRKQFLALYIVIKKERRMFMAYINLTISFSCLTSVKFASIRCG